MPPEVLLLSYGRPLGRESLLPSTIIKATTNNWKIWYNTDRIYSLERSDPDLWTTSDITGVSTPPLQTCNVGMGLQTEPHPPRPQLAWAVSPPLHSAPTTQSLISISYWPFIIIACILGLIYDISSVTSGKKITEGSGAESNGTESSQEHSLHATCEPKVGWSCIGPVFLNESPAVLSVQSGQGLGSTQAASQLVTESLGSFDDILNVC